VLYKHGGGIDREVRVGGRIVDGNEREATKNLDGAESAFDPPFGPHNTHPLARTPQVRARAPEGASQKTGPVKIPARERHTGHAKWTRWNLVVAVPTPSP